MECYNRYCEEECNEFKAMYCFKKVTKKQQEVIARLKGRRYCRKCGERLVKAKYITGKCRHRRINLCTRCGAKRNMTA